MEWIQFIDATLRVDLVCLRRKRQVLVKLPAPSCYSVFRRSKDAGTTRVFKNTKIKRSMQHRRCLICKRKTLKVASMHIQSSAKRRGLGCINYLPGSAWLYTDFLSAGKVTVDGNQTMLKFICFYKTFHLIFKIFTRASKNISTFCWTNPDICRLKIISRWPMRCLKREPACLISASFCRHISRRNVFKAQTHNLV